MRKMYFFTIIQQKIAATGFDEKFPGHIKKRIFVFNQLNFLALLLSLLRFIYIALFTPIYYHIAALIINFSLTLFFACMIWAMHKQLFKIATLASFIVIPPLLALVSWSSKDNGLDMFVLLYMMFSFFFLHRLKNIIMAFLYCLVFFLIIHFIFQKGFDYTQTNAANFYLIIFNYLIAFLMFFSSLYLIKYQVRIYEKSVKEKNKVLNEREIEIEAKNETLSMQAENLKHTTHELTELNQVKSKLFSVISHDLRTSVYSLKNMFDALRLGYITNDELIHQLPGLSNELDNCTEVMENLLNWGKDRFKDNRVMMEQIELNDIAATTCKHLLYRAGKKNITLKNNVPHNTYAYADGQMLKIVMRNLVANAIKFTPSGGRIEIFSVVNDNSVMLSVKDNGVGMAPDALRKVFNNEYYTTLGTNKETGTGLGLVICRDFIKSNNGELKVKSLPHQGTTFTIALPLK